MKMVYILFLFFSLCFGNENKLSYLTTASMDFGGKALVSSKLGDDIMRANEGFQLSIGLHYKFDDLISLKGTLGIKRSVKKDNNLNILVVYDFLPLVPYIQSVKIEYETYPIEFTIGFETLIGKLDVGVIYHMKPHIDVIYENVAIVNETINYDNALGYLLTYEPTYLIHNKSIPWGIRVTKMDYHINGNTINANSYGAYISYIF